MDKQRRSFLKKTGAAGVVALAAGASAPESARAQGAGLGASPVRVGEVKVWETDTASATYRP